MKPTLSLSLSQILQLTNHRHITHAHIHLVTPPFVYIKERMLEDLLQLERQVSVLSVTVTVKYDSQVLVFMDTVLSKPDPVFNQHLVTCHHTLIYSIYLNS